MKYTAFMLALVLPATLALPLPAGPIFGKHNKTNPAERVPQLIAAVKSEKDDGKRADAAKALRDYDPAAFPDIIPVLADVVLHDAKPSVRAEAAQSLGKLRPVSQEGGVALEQATHDSSFRVRLQARSALLSYHLAGYHGTPKEGEAKAAPAPAKDAPGIAATPQQAVRTTVPQVPHPTPSPIAGETPPPPLAQPVPATPPSQTAPRPFTATPATPVPAGPPQSVDQGPEIPPG
jgi:hypothetical protein